MRIIEGAGSIDKTKNGEVYIFGGYKVARIDYLYNYREYDEIYNQLNAAKRDLNSILISEGDIASSSREKIEALRTNDELTRSKILKKTQEANQRKDIKVNETAPNPINPPAVDINPTDTGASKPVGNTQSESDPTKLQPISTSCCLCCKKEKYIRVNPKTKRPAASIENILYIKEYLLQAYNSRPLMPAKLKIYKDFSLNFQLKFIECNYLNSKVHSADRSWTRSSRRCRRASSNTITAQL